MPTKKLTVISCYSVCLLASIGLNIFLVTKAYYSYLQSDDLKKYNKLSWTREAAEEAEAMASISCSGHGRAYLDGLVTKDGNPICECNTCYEGPDCSVLSLDCAANAESGDPLFLEPFWMQHAASSSVLVPSWHRMSYDFTYDERSAISKELEIRIRRLHEIAKNAITEGKYILFGVGSTQLLNAAVYALSMNMSSRVSVVASSPFFWMYKSQTNFFENKNFEFKGDARELINNASSSSDYDSDPVIEFVTSPNNPDGNLKEAVFQGRPSAKFIYDHAYYWPHFTAIPVPANGDVMIFTISKFTGHAGSRFGWAIVKDYNVYQNMQQYIQLAEMSISKETQLRAFKIMKTLLEGNGSDIFNYAHAKMRRRWKEISSVISVSKRLSLQEIPPIYCSFFRKVRGPSPAYAWLKCEREEDTDCNEVLRAAKIIGRPGSSFSIENRYVRLSLLKSDDDFNLLLYRLKDFVANEYSAKIMRRSIIG